jgi:hypothetical protein
VEQHFIAKADQLRAFVAQGIQDLPHFRECSIGLIEVEESSHAGILSRRAARAHGQHAGGPR